MGEALSFHVSGSTVLCGRTSGTGGPPRGGGLTATGGSWGGAGRELGVVPSWRARSLQDRVSEAVGLSAVDQADPVAIWLEDLDLVVQVGHSPIALPFPPPPPRGGGGFAPFPAVSLEKSLGRAPGGGLLAAGGS